MTWRVLFYISLLVLPASGVFQTANCGQSLPPRGYYAKLELLHQGRQLFFGPFVGYYFKPVKGDDLSRLEFLCYNERKFYTDQLPENTLLYTGKAILRTLDEVQEIPRQGSRIIPIFFADAPPEWLRDRPVPQDEYLHFHSAYDKSGAVYTGYWLRHRAETEFIYNMGGRLSKESPLYHQAHPAKPHLFPQIIEFDAGSE